MVIHVGQTCLHAADVIVKYCAHGSGHTDSGTWPEPHPAVQSKRAKGAGWAKVSHYQASIKQD